MYAVGDGPEGGALYQMWLSRHGAPWAFSAVLVVGMLLNLSCYLLWRYLRRGQESLSSASAAPMAPRSAPRLMMFATSRSDTIDHSSGRG